MSAGVACISATAAPASSVRWRHRRRRACHLRLPEVGGEEGGAPALTGVPPSRGAPWQYPGRRAAEVAAAERGLPREIAAAAHQHERLDRAGGALAAVLRRAQHRRLLRCAAAAAEPRERRRRLILRRVELVARDAISRLSAPACTSASRPSGCEPTARPRGTPPPAPRAPRTRAARRARHAPFATHPVALEAAVMATSARHAATCARPRPRAARRAGAPRARAQHVGRQELRAIGSKFEARRSACRRRRSARRSASSRGRARFLFGRIIMQPAVCNLCDDFARWLAEVGGKSTTFCPGDRPSSASARGRAACGARCAENCARRRHGGRLARHAAHAALDAESERSTGTRRAATGGSIARPRWLQSMCGRAAPSATRSRRGALPAAWRRSASRSPSSRAQPPSRGRSRIPAARSRRRRTASTWPTP